MHIGGQWYPCSDGIVRPVLRGEILSGKGAWEPTLFLLDTGADRTVLSAATLAALALPEAPPGARLGGVGGVGGVVEAVLVETRIRFPREDNARVIFTGAFAAFRELESLDMSVLGRDITGLFAVIADQPGNVVAMVRERHGYTIGVSPPPR